MSVTTKAIGLAKKVKHHFQDQIQAAAPVYLSPVRRIERVALSQRVCAMTFDDGPCRLPANPGNDQPLTLRLAETLEKYGAAGTFDIVGDTSGNYPDKAGREGSAEWGGIRYDHYPDFGKDADGGALHCSDLVQRLLDGGHEITSHTWSHTLFGPKPLVYGKRTPFSGLEEVTGDLRTMDEFMKSHYDYTIRLSRPPHYVDKMRDGFTSYDAYARMGYQYMAASFDGAGWLPLPDYEAEVEATWKPMAQALEADASALCGQIIFQKDGYNMARRSPVADGLEKQLSILKSYGYRVVTVSQLLAMSPFRDLSPEQPLFRPARKLLDKGWCVAFRDNTVRPDAPLRRGELAMMAYGWEQTELRIEMLRSRKAPAKDVSCSHPYAAAIALALENGTMQAVGGRFRPNAPVTVKELEAFCKARFKALPAQVEHPLNHAAAICALADLL